MVNLFRYKCNWRSFLLLFCALIISFKSFGETVTTGNLLPNANDGVDWNSNSTDQINSAILLVMLLMVLLLMVLILLVLINQIVDTNIV